MKRPSNRRILILVIFCMAFIALVVGVLFAGRTVIRITRAYTSGGIAAFCCAYERDHGEYPTPDPGKPAWTALGHLVPQYVPNASRFLIRFQPSRRDDRRALARFEGPGPLPSNVKISYWYSPPSDRDALMLAERPERVWPRGILLAADALGVVIAFREGELRERIGPSLSEY